MSQVKGFGAQAKGSGKIKAQFLKKFPNMVWIVQSHQITEKG
jgi:hypothetical protein